MRIIAALIGAMLLYQLQQILYRRYWNKNLTVDIRLSDDKAVEGDQLDLIETVTNRKLLPIPVLKIKYMASRFLIFLDMHQSEVTDHTYRNDLISVMMFQKLTRSIPFVCTKRGYYTIDKMVLVCNDILLESELVASYDLCIHLYVYPKPLEYSRFGIPFQKMLGTILTKRFINEDPFEFKGIREYQRYDMMKNINWKASAKTGSLMVNQYDHTSSQQIKILLNLESNTLRIYEDLMEEAIRLAATAATYFIEQGIPTALSTNAYDIVSRELLGVPAGSGLNHTRTINETLARIDDTMTPPPFVSTLHEELTCSNPNDYIVLISTYQRTDLLKKLSALSQKQIDFSWIIPTNKEVPIIVEDELLSHVIPWEL